MIRREFFGSLAASGLVAAFPSVALAEHERNAALRPVDDAWDMSWASRLRGKSRAVFDSPHVAEGGALWRAILWRDQYSAVFGTPREELTPIVVFRHDAIPLIMDDTHWDQFNVGKDLKMKDPKTKKWFKRNPLSAAPADASADEKKFTIPAFIADGGIVLACALAFEDVVLQVMERAKLSNEEADKVSRQRIIPGVIMQPSGFFAVLKAQDEGCKYMMGS